MVFLLILRFWEGIFTNEEVRLNDHQLYHILSLFLKPMVISCFWHYPSATPVSLSLSSKFLIKSLPVYLVINGNINNTSFGPNCVKYLCPFSSKIPIEVLHFQYMFLNCKFLLL